MTELLTKIMPPGCTSSWNFRREGRFSTMSSEGRAKTGEPTRSVERTTEQLAVPPRISGP